MKKYLFALGAVALSAPVAALTVHTELFITAPTQLNSFEGLGPVTPADGVSSHSEDGIHVEYVGEIYGGGITSQSAWAPAIDGSYSWYPEAGGSGYTRITFEAADAIQFLALSGWSTEVSLGYTVLLDDVEIASGEIASLSSSHAGEWRPFGFSGAAFNEVRLWSGGMHDAAGFDAIAIGAVPEPAGWALMAAGLALVGLRLRRRPQPI